MAPGRDGSSEFDHLYRENVRFVWRSLRHLGVREADLEDQCHEVFLIVGRKWKEFQGRSTVRTWVYGICIRTASDYRRRAYVRREQPTEEVPDAELPAGQDTNLERSRLRKKLLALLDELDPLKREVFVLYEIEELPMKEVAIAVGCPLQTAYSRLHAARKQLAEALRPSEAAQ